MHKSFTRLSLATALLMGAALPVFAQGGSTPAGTGQATPATRPAVTSAAPAANGPAIAARPATPAHPAGSVQPQAARPATAPAQGATLQGHASQAQRPVATPGTPAVPSRVN